MLIFGRVILKTYRHTGAHVAIGMLTNHARLNTCQVVNGILKRWSDGEHVDPRDCGITGNGKTFHKLFPIRLKFSNVTKEVK